MSGSSVIDRPVSGSEPARWTVSRWWAPIGGLVAVTAAFASTELLAAIGIWAKVFSPASSPVQSLANTFITLTPEWLKHWAITTFGTDDKLALGAGMFATIAVAALILGLVAGWRRPIATVLMVVLAVVAAVASITRHGADPLDLLPLLIGTAVGVAAIRYLFPSPVGDAVAVGPVVAVVAVATVGTDREPAGGRIAVGRRTFLRRLGLTGVAAAAAGVAARYIPTGASARASRAAVVLAGVSGLS
jgi:hypothetical protein